MKRLPWPSPDRGGEWSDWRWHRRSILRNPEEISALFPSLGPRISEGMAAAGEYPPAVTPYYLSLADAADPFDPILAQCLPSAAESACLELGEDDPLREAAQSPVRGLVHRYPDRALMLVTSACFVRCRHCNRKRLWREPERAAGEAEIGDMIEYLAVHREVREVIVSGGDPFTLPAPRLDEILGALRRVPHLEAIRVGTRAPVTLPMRVDAELAAVLAKHGPIWINTHFNHPREVTAEAAAACRRLLMAGCPVGNQTVLLRGVNDSEETVIDLCHALQRIGVRPYYLFQCDPVRGVGHFRTKVSRGMEIIGRMRGFTSGLCVPTFAVDTPGGGGKVVLQPDPLIGTGRDSVLLRNFEGNLFEYPEPAGD